MAKIKFFLSLKLQLFIFCLIVFIPIILISSYLFHQHSRTVLLESLKNKLLTVVILSSSEFNLKDINKLNKPEDVNKPEYMQIKQNLVNLQNKMPFIKYTSIIIRKSTESAYYVVDSLTKTLDLNKDGKVTKMEGLVLIGDKASEIKITSDPALAPGFSKPTISNVIYTDKNGEWIRAFAPIPGDKKYLPATLVIDMYLNIKDENNKFLGLFENILVISFIIILLLLFLATKLFLYPIKKIKEHINNIRNGDFNQKIKYSWVYGEIGELVESVNELTDILQKQSQKSLENKENFEEKQKIIEVTSQQIKSKNHQLNNTILTLNTINELLEELIHKKDTTTLMEAVLQPTINLIKSLKGIILEYLPEENEFKVLTTFDTTNISPNMRVSLNDTPCLKKIFETKNYINIYEPGKIKDEEYKIALASPMILEKEVKGIIFLMDKEEIPDKTENYFEETDEATLKTLSKLIAAVWESIHLFELASIDNMSKLYVRRYLEKNLEEEIKKAARLHQNLNLIVLDIDNFKMCNEAYGYSLGDQVIKDIADKIKDFISEEDLAARYGGEKLVVLLPGKTKDEGQSIAEQMREAIENMDIISTEGDAVKITVSIGVSSFPEHGNTVEELIKSADQALYKAKIEGKNKVILAGTD